MEWRRRLHERSIVGIARTITRIEAHPNNERQIVATLMGFDCRHHPLPHVLWFDGKREWIDLSDAGSPDAVLPNVHHNVVTWDENGEYMFVGNDAGVWALHTPGGKVETTKGKYAWVDISANLPNAIVTDLVYHDKSKSLTAGVWSKVSGVSNKTSGLPFVQATLAQRKKNSTIAEALIESHRHAPPIHLVWLSSCSLIQQ